MSLYLDHFGLSEPPFRITPHTDFFFNGADRGATLDALIYAVLHDEGIVKVSGEVGSGKTMLCRVLIERLPARVETIYLATPSLARDEILHAIADELDLELSQPRTTVALRELQECLIRLDAAGRRVVVLVAEAHAMPEETLEQIRLLSNLESNRHKLLQLVLFGQPELDLEAPLPGATGGEGAIVDQAARLLEQAGSFSLDETLKAWERAYIDAALRLTKGNVSQAAKLLGVNRTTLYSRMNSEGEK